MSPATTSNLDQQANSVVTIQLNLLCKGRKQGCGGQRTKTWTGKNCYHRDRGLERSPSWAGMCQESPARSRPQENPATQQTHSTQATMARPCGCRAQTPTTLRQKPAAGEGFGSDRGNVGSAREGDRVCDWLACGKDGQLIHLQRQWDKPSVRAAHCPTVRHCCCSPRQHLLVGNTKGQKSCVCSRPGNHGWCR